MTSYDEMYEIIEEWFADNNVTLDTIAKTYSAIINAAEKTFLIIRSNLKGRMSS